MVSHRIRANTPPLFQHVFVPNSCNNDDDDDDDDDDDNDDDDDD